MLVKQLFGFQREELRFGVIWIVKRYGVFVQRDYLNESFYIFYVEVGQQLIQLMVRGIIMVMEIKGIVYEIDLNCDFYVCV